MGFTARQVYCLERMGIVPWVLKTSAAAGNRTEAADTMVSAAAEPLVHDEIALFTPWLGEQRLLRFTHRGSSTEFAGARDAPLLVISEIQDSGVQAVPLDTDESALFDLMLQAIGLNRTHCSLCAVSAARAAPLTDPDTLTVSELCSQQTRAIIYFSRQFREAQPASEHKGLLPPHSMPLWRMPHPALLLSNPLLKRVAWESLKAIRNKLDTP